MTKRVLYIADLAVALGMTEAAIRGHIQRRSNALPPWVKLGKRVAWRAQDVETWLADLKPVVTRPKRGPGRPSKSSSTSRPACRSCALTSATFRYWSAGPVSSIRPATWTP